MAAVRRWSGNARRQGPWSDVESELADIVITAFVTAATMTIDLPDAINRKLAVIFSRGWHEGEPLPSHRGRPYSGPAGDTELCNAVECSLCEAILAERRAVRVERS